MRSSISGLLTAALLGTTLAACSKTTPSPTPEPAASQQAPAAEARDKEHRGRRDRGDRGPDDGPGRHGGRGFGRGWDTDRFLSLADKNKNGSVELTELPESARARFTEFDANKNGALSRDELDAVGKKMIEKRFAAMDKNKDGAITSDEMPERMWTRFKVADADNNNSISLAEMADAQKNGKLRGPGGRKPDDKAGDRAGDKAGEHEGGPDLEEMIKDASE